MELTTRLDRTRYHWLGPAVEKVQPAALLVEVTTPALPASERTTPASLVVVLDRSGSMGGDRLEHAQRALCDVVDRLGPTDLFGLVAFDDTVDVIVPAGPVTEPEGIKRAICSLRPRGSTDLAAGLLRGFKEARRLETEAGVRVLLISDGHANRGVTDPAIIGPKVAELVDSRITTSSLGVGLGYDETLLDVIAKEGTGDMYFAAEADTAVGAIAQECGELLGHRFLQCRLTISPGNGVGAVTLLNDLPHRTTPIGDLVIELGNLGSDRSRSLVLLFDPKQAIKPGRRKVGTLRLSYTLADDLSDGSTSQTVWARIAAPDDKPGRIDRQVTSEVLFQQIQGHHAAAAEALYRGAIDRAVSIYRRILSELRAGWSQIPLERRPEFESLVDQVVRALELLERDAAGNASAMSKHGYAQTSLAMRKRDRRRPSTS